MQDQLVELIRSTRHGDVYCKERMFADSFRSGANWLEYINRHFDIGGQLSVENILNKSGDQWQTEDFHALYIACWIFEPLAKGSFMIKLSDMQAENARAGYETLEKIELKIKGDERNYTGRRWTSHLSESGASARRGWRFLEGYHELLVQLEQGSGGTGTHLFLKAEGHASHKIEHLKSFKTKVMTGHGEVCNPFLEAVAKTRTELGLSSRSAENYSNKYGKLLKHLGLHGKTVSATTAVTAMYKSLEAGFGEAHKGRLTEARAAAGLPPQMPVDAMSNGQLGRLLSCVIVPLASDIAGTSFRDKVKSKLGGKLAGIVPMKYADFGTTVVEAAKDLDALADKLGKDEENNPYGQRYFLEVVLLPHQIDQALNAFKSVYHEFDTLAA